MIFATVVTAGTALVPENVGGEADRNQNFLHESSPVKSCPVTLVIVLGRTNVVSLCAKYKKDVGKLVGPSAMEATSKLKAFVKILPLPKLVHVEGEMKQTSDAHPLREYAPRFVIPLGRDMQINDVQLLNAYPPNITTSAPMNALINVCLYALDVPPITVFPVAYPSVYVPLPLEIHNLIM
jgi:hypothetical protein